MIGFWKITDFKAGNKRSVVFRKGMSNKFVNDPNFLPYFGSPKLAYASIFPNVLLIESFLFQRYIQVPSQSRNLQLKAFQINW